VESVIVFYRICWRKSWCCYSSV